MKTILDLINDGTVGEYGPIIVDSMERGMEINGRHLVTTLWAKARYVLTHFPGIIKGLPSMACRASEYIFLVRLEMLSALS